MKNSFTIFKVAFTIVLLNMAVLVSTGISASVEKMTKEELKPIMNNKEVVILDVRQGRDWSSSEFKIKGAVRVPGKEISNVTGTYSKTDTMVLYCA